MKQEKQTHGERFYLRGCCCCRYGGRRNGKAMDDPGLSAQRARLQNVLGHVNTSKSIIGAPVVIYLLSLPL